MSEWIKCADRMPEPQKMPDGSSEFGQFLVFGDEGFRVATWRPNTLWSESDTLEGLHMTPTHWMPLPDPPR